MEAVDASKYSIDSGAVGCEYFVKITMRILGLYGHGQCGKSAMLNEVKELLRVAGISISKQPHPYSESPETFSHWSA